MKTMHQRIVRAIHRVWSAIALDCNNNDPVQDGEQAVQCCMDFLGVYGEDEEAVAAYHEMDSDDQRSVRAEAALNIL